jgi:nucleotide-binding universal stress UspA family protein
MRRGVQNGSRPSAPVRRVRRLIQRKADRHPRRHRRHQSVQEPVMKILLPVDGSEYTQRMLAYIAAHGELLGPGHDYVAFTAVPPIPARAASHLSRSTLDDYYGEQAEQALAPVKAFAAQNGWTLRTAFKAGHAADTIVKFAEGEHPDLIVMGTHGHSPLGNILLGSVTTGVLARCKTPVLLVR